MATYSCRRPRTEVALTAFNLAVCICCLYWATPTVGTSSGSGRPDYKLDAGFVKLHFYIQEVLDSSTFVVVPPLPGHGTSFFGAVSVADQNATATPDPASTIIARVKGVAVAANNEDNRPLVLAIASTAVFTEASGYGGSSFSFQGINDAALSVNEISITGGTGKFRLARGWLEFTSFQDSTDPSRTIVDLTAYVYYGK